MIPLSKPNKFQAMMWLNSGFQKTTTCSWALGADLFHSMKSLSKVINFIRSNKQHESYVLQLIIQLLQVITKYV